MGNNRPVKTKDWVAFLEANKCNYIRTKASHDHYKCPGCFRTITHRLKKYSSIPFSETSNGTPAAKSAFCSEAKYKVF